MDSINSAIQFLRNTGEGLLKAEPHQAAVFFATTFVAYKALTYVTEYTESGKYFSIRNRFVVELGKSLIALGLSALTNGQATSLVLQALAMAGITAGMATFGVTVVAIMVTYYYVRKSANVEDRIVFETNQATAVLQNDLMLTRHELASRPTQLIINDLNTQIRALQTQVITSLQNQLGSAATVAVSAMQRTVDQLQENLHRLMVDVGRMGEDFENVGARVRAISGRIDGLDRRVEDLAAAAPAAPGGAVV